MADKPQDKNLVPGLIQQNPAPFTADSQGRKDANRAQVDRIMAAFYKLLPSNYASQVQGPYYTMQFQAMAERIADFQVNAQEVMTDSMYDYTRTEVLYQILGSLVFPDAPTDGFPDLEGDLTYRTFLQRMVALLIQGATKATVKSGIELLTTSVVEVIERGIEARKLKGLSPWSGPGDQFTFEVNITNDNKFPDEDPFVLQRNVDIVLRALKPAHTLYEYRHVFVEVFGTLFVDEDAWIIKDYKYQDLRRYWLGAKSISGRQGITLTDKTLFSDPTRDFSNINVGAVLAITTGPNATRPDASIQTPDGRLENFPGRYRVIEVLGFPIPTDATPRAYTTSPSGLSGSATISDGYTVTDGTQDWGLASEGETITFTTGPNAGTYRLKTVLGLSGGSVGTVGVTGTQARIAPSILRTKVRMTAEATAQAYEVDVDRLGVQKANQEVGEVAYKDLTDNSILTNRGPLVKDWGDMTPATINDVFVTINAVQTAIVSVNPHTGHIVLADPFIWSDVVLVSYYWMATPVMVMSGLNEHGQVLNKWDRLLTGHHTSTITPRLGAPDIARFPYCVVLGPMDTPEPILIGHRYMGFEKAYSALLNSSTSLVLNTNPHQYDAPGFEQVPQGSTEAYEATTTPQAASPPWGLIGIDNGTVVGDGTYRVIDANIGSYAATPPCTMFKQDMDMGFPASMVLVSRYLVNPPPYDAYSATTSYLPGDKVLVGTNLYICTTATQGNDPPNTDFWTLVASTSVGIMADAADGVFVGVGFGFHQNKRLYMVGNLLVNGVQHVGMLKDARNPHLLASWDVGPTTLGTIASATTITFTMGESYPSSFIVGNRFQILAPHTQAGVYTATKVTPQSANPTKTYSNTATYLVGDVVKSDGVLYECITEATGKYPPNSVYWSLFKASNNTVTVTVTPAFPVDFTQWGNKYPDVVFETLWLSKPTTYRLTMYPSATSTTALNIKLALSGETSVAKVLEGDAFGTDLPQVATSSLALFLDQANPDKKIGTTVWGSLSYAAMNDTTWSFLRYGIIPNATAYRGHEKTANTAMTVLPENEADPAWFQTEAFGLSQVGHGVMLLKATSANTALDTSFAYGRDEPFFKKDSNLDLTTYFKVETGVLGAGDAEIVLNDKVREARVATLSYYANVVLNPYRQLVTMPNVSFAGLIHPTLQGWTKARASDDAATNHENDVVFDLTANSARYLQNLAMLDLVPPDGGERVIEGQFAIDTNFVLGVGGKTGVFIAGDFGTMATGGVAVTVWDNAGTPTVSLANPTGLVSVQGYPFDWTDGLQHTYRVVVSGGAVSLFVDDVVQIPTKVIADFAGMGSTQHWCVFGAIGTASRSGQVRWRSASYSCLPHADVKRTLGVYLGGDRNDIDNWEIPRTDATTTLNSEQTGPVIEEMDWTSYMTVRVLRTWDWGITVYRPDMAPPPFFNGDWATQTMQPSAGWITVEYTKLPYVPRTMGFVGFGSFDSRAIMQSRWDYVNFRLFKPITDDWIAPQHMVLNQANVVTSGEPLLDDTLETVIIMPLVDNRRVLLKPTHIFAHDVWKVVDGNTIYTRESWTFDREAQLLTLNPNPNGTNVYFTGQAVTIVYAPGKPFTDTYLETQKLLDSMTLLNQGTPPVPKSQHNPDVVDIYTDGQYTAKTFKTDPYGVVTPAAPGFGQPSYDSMYENMKFMEVNDGGWENLIAIAGEGFLQPGFTGWEPTEGEISYDSNGDPVGFVGNAVGGHVIWVKGAAYWTKVEGWNDQLQTFHMIDMAGPAPADALSFFDETLGQYLFVSGGTFMKDVVDYPAGNVIGDAPAGGLLNSGMVLYPSKAIH